MQAEPCLYQAQTSQRNITSSIATIIFLAARHDVYFHLDATWFH
jgi:hypothetical protein